MRRRTTAEKESATATQVSKFLIKLFSTADPIRYRNLAFDKEVKSVQI